MFVRKQKVNYKKTEFVKIHASRVQFMVMCAASLQSDNNWPGINTVFLVFLYICVKRGHFDNVCAKLFEISFKNVFNYTVAR